MYRLPNLPTVTVTTSDPEYDLRFETCDTGALRHPDDRFEGTRTACRAWAAGIAERTGHMAPHSGIGDTHPAYGAVTLMVVLT